MAKVLKPRGLIKRRGRQGRTDGWVGGRADTWHGHYTENPASRAGADAHRMAGDKEYSAEVAETLRRRDELPAGEHQCRTDDRARLSRHRSRCARRRHDRPPLGSICFAQWDSLSPVLKAFLEGRTAIHGRAGNDEVEHPICRTHPVIGKSALYVNPTFTNSICGMEPADSARFLAQLYAKMYSTPEHTCRFQWRDGSVAMWDNRSCQHYAVSDFWPHERRMERVTLIEPSDEDEVPFWLDDNGKRHYSVLLTSKRAIDTPLGYS